MQATNVDTNNTGKVFVAYGQQPVATVGHPSQGEVLIQAAAFEEPAAGLQLDKKYKQAVWAIADTASQSVVVEEEIES